MSAVWKLFVKRTANWLRLLHRAITIFIPWLSGLLSAIQLRQLSSMRVWNLTGCKFPSVGFLPLALCGLTSDVPYFILLDGKQWKSLTVSDPSRGAGSMAQGDARTSPWGVDI
jgi:hypothetical protein